MGVYLNPEADHISSSVTSHFKPNQSMNSIYFDLSKTLSISEVKYHGGNISFQQMPTKDIKIDLPGSIPANKLDSLIIHYSLSPSIGFYSFPLQNVPAISTLNQPYFAHDWFPTKQNLNDKIEKPDFKITTPSQHSVGSNRKLISKTILPKGKKLTFRRTIYSTSVYLEAFSLTDFVALNETIGNPPFPFVNYVFTFTNANIQNIANINWTKDVMNMFESYLGVSMEYEPAHQYFGNKVTYATWNDICPNDGFASFGEHLANEKLLLITSQFMNYLIGQKNYITSFTGGSTYISNTELWGTDRIFNNRLNYTKRGYIIRMVKWMLDDTIFHQAVKDYHTTQNLAYSYSITSDFRTRFLQFTGKDITVFFSDWLYKQGYSTYTIKWKQMGSQMHFKARQTQNQFSISFFEMSLSIKVNRTAKEVAFFTLNRTSNNQEFLEPIYFPVGSVGFNYDHQILDKNSMVVNDTLLRLLYPFYER